MTLIAGNRSELLRTAGAVRSMEWHSSECERSALLLLPPEILLNLLERLSVQDILMVSSTCTCLYALCADGMCKLYPRLLCCLFQFLCHALTDLAVILLRRNVCRVVCCDAIAGGGMRPTNCVAMILRFVRAR